MDERKIKRLLVMVAVSIIVIMVFKSMMLKTAVSINKVAMEKKQAAAPTPASPVEDDMAASGVESVEPRAPSDELAASAVPEAALVPAVSGTQQE